MELLTKKYVYQIVGESTVGSNECIIKSEALSLASKNRKNVTSDLSAYSSNEYIDKFEVEDMPDLRKFKFAKTAFQFGEAGGNGTSAVVSTDIDGNDIAFTALANVDWVNVTKAKDNTVEFTVNSNTGNMRSAKITGTNSTGFTDTISIQQDAYTPQYSHTYTLRINGAASQPTKVVINNQEVTPVKQDSSYVCTYTYRSSNTDDAPSKVSYSIAGGLKNQEVLSAKSSVSPLSWNLDNGLTKSFDVSLILNVRSYSWDYQSGVDNFINIDSEDVVEMKSADSTHSVSTAYVISAPTGITTTTNGMTFTATASSTSNTGTMTVKVPYDDGVHNISITYDPAIVEKTYTYTLKATGASSTPKMTINNQSITPTYASGVYTGVYSTTCPEGSQPSTVTWSISDGVPSTDWGQYYISTSPSSWSVTGAGSKDFSVSISQDKTEYSWSATSGTIAYNDSASCRIVSEDGTWTPSSDNIKVSVDSPSWVSTSMSGSTLTATTDGSETSDRSGNIRLTTAYSDGAQGTCYISVNYTAPTIEEVWPDWSDSSVVYTFGFGVRGSSSPSVTSISGEFNADGSEKQSGTYGRYEVVSYKTRISNLGNTEDKEVNYTGEIGKPSANASASSRSDSGTITQKESGKTITWSWTQDGAEVIWSDWAYSFGFAGGGNTLHDSSDIIYNSDGSMASGYVNVISRKERTNNVGQSETEEVGFTGKVWSPSGSNTSTSDITKSGTLVQNESGNTISWTATQYGKESVTTGPYYDNFSATSISFPYTGGSKTITCTKYYLVDGVRSNETTESKTITCSENTSTSSKSWTETFNGLTINCTQDGKPEDPILGPYYKNVHPTSVTIGQTGGYETIYYTKYYTLGGEEINSTTETTTVGTPTANDSYTEKVWLENIHGTVVTVTQLAKEETHDYEFYFVDSSGNKSTSITETMDAAGNVTSGNYSIVSTDNGNSCTYHIDDESGDLISGANYTEGSLTRTEIYKQSGSGNTITRIITQSANEKEYYIAAMPSRITGIPYNNGEISVQIEGYWTWKYGDSSTKHDRDVLTKTADVGTNASKDSTRIGTETFSMTIGGKTLTVDVDWIQDKAPSATVVSDYIEYDELQEFPAKGGTHSVSVAHIQKMSDGSEVTAKTGTVSVKTTDNYNTTSTDGANQLTFDGIEFTLYYIQKACDYRTVTLSVAHPQVQGDTITVIGNLSESCPFSVSAGASGNFVSVNGTTEGWSANLIFDANSSSTTGEYTDPKGDVSSVEMTGSSIYTGSRWFGDSIYYKL